MDSSHAELSSRLLADCRDLHRRLREAVSGLDGATLDRQPIDGANSITVLITHLLASELDWLATAADKAVTRDRDSEFRTSGGAAIDLVARIDSAEAQALDHIRVALEAGVETPRSHARTGRVVTIGYCLLHSIEHTSEHVGHVELTRQLVRYA